MAKPTCPECGGKKVRKESPLAFLGVILVLGSLIAGILAPPIVFLVMLVIGLALSIVGFASQYQWACANRSCKHKWKPA
jgi:hypothetical protein